MKRTFIIVDETSANVVSTDVIGLQKSGVVVLGGICLGGGAAYAVGLGGTAALFLGVIELNEVMHTEHIFRHVLLACIWSVLAGVIEVQQVSRWNSSSCSSCRVPTHSWQGHFLARMRAVKEHDEAGVLIDIWSVNAGSL